MLSLILAGSLLGVAADSTPGARLAALADLVWQHQTERDGGARLRAGLPVLHLPDFSEAGARADAAFWRKVGTTLTRRREPPATPGYRGSPLRPWRGRGPAAE